MAEEAEEVEGEETESEDEGSSRRFGLKKILMFVVLPVVVLCGGAGGAWWFGLIGGSSDAEMVSAPAPKPAYFYDLPEMTINLSSVENRTQYLRLKVALEISDDDLVDMIEPVLPRVLDAFQVYLRELRVSDIEGSAGLMRLKEELQRRINVAVYPVKVDSVLFKEILIQ
ncbi:MAG: flagellar basal body-associated FliL family protein [Hyphomicrobiales bacterium]|nr:flagellar basal body-associated FliL family protein [Hyphomicrobiales bacterium]